MAGVWLSLITSFKAVEQTLKKTVQSTCYKNVLSILHSLKSVMLIKKSLLMFLCEIMVV